MVSQESLDKLPVKYQLTRTTIKNIESMLTPDNILEIIISDGRLVVTARPRTQDEILIQPTLLCAEEDTTVVIIVERTGEVPVYLARVNVPAGYWLTGLKLAREDEKP